MNPEKNSRSVAAPPPRSAQVDVRKVRLPGNVAGTRGLFPAHLPAARGRRAARGGRPGWATGSRAHRDRDRDRGAGAHTWLHTPVASRESEWRRTRRRAPLPPSTQRRVFPTRDEFPPSDPGGRLSPMGFLPRIRVGGRGFPRRRLQPRRGGRWPRGSPDLDGALPVLREPPSRCLRPVAEKRPPGRTARGPGARRHRLASRCQRSLDLPARSPLTARRRASRAPRMPSTRLGSAHARTRAARSQIHSPGLACSRAAEHLVDPQRSRQRGGWDPVGGKGTAGTLSRLRSKPDQGCRPRTGLQKWPSWTDKQQPGDSVEVRPRQGSGSQL